jgi:CubicO group peptidase (beta-lactamase class C family)
MNVCRQAAFFMAVLTALLATPLRAEPAAETPAAFGTALKSWAAKYGIRQAFVVVRRNGVVAHRTVLGGLDPRRQVALASMSKAITGACVAALMRAGKLALDTPVSAALAKFIAAHGQPRDLRLANATIAQLLTHRAGFPTGDDDDPASGRNLDDYLKTHSARKPPTPALLAAVLRSELTREPGTQYAYGNAAYFVLGAIVEEASGRPYPEFCADAVLKPLGVAGSIVPSWRVSPADGGWQMTAEDYLKFLAAFDPNDARLGTVAKSWMLEPDGKRLPDGVTWYGFGTWLRKLDEKLMIWHRGAMDYEPDKSDIGAVRANFVANATHVSDGTSWFVYVIQPDGARAKYLELFDALTEAYRTVKEWR